MALAEKLISRIDQNGHLLRSGTLRDLRDEILEIIENPDEIPLIWGTGVCGEVNVDFIRPKQPVHGRATVDNFRFGIDYALQKNFGAMYHFEIFDSKPCKYEDRQVFLGVYLSKDRRSISLKFKFNSEGGFYDVVTQEEEPDKEVFENMRKFLGPL